MLLSIHMYPYNKIPVISQLNQNVDGSTKKIVYIHVWTEVEDASSHKTRQMKLKQKPPCAMRYFRHITGKVSKSEIYEILLHINNKSKTKNKLRI